MPFSLNRETMTATHPTRPAPWLPWIASALFLVGLLAAVITVAAAMASNEDGGLRIRVVEAGTTAALEDVVVTINGESFQTDADGIVSIANNPAPMTVEISRVGYHGKSGTIDVGESSHGFVVALRPIEQESLALNSSNRIAEGSRSAPVGGGITDLTGDSTPEPSRGSAVTSSPETSMSRGSIATPPASSAGLFAGAITSPAGDPVQGAIVTDGKAVEVTGADGLFQFPIANTTADSIRVFAPGFAELHIPVSEVSAGASLQLEPQKIKGIYFNPNISNTQADIDRLINLINTTEVNALVIDIKEGLIFYDSKVPFFVNAGTVAPSFDLPALLATLEENDIYAIARLVVFKDSIVAEKYPELAVKNEVTGDVWRDMNGVAWVNPMDHTLWDANAALAVEAANLGFDEIQYDYVRFPTDGDLSTMDFGLEYNEENRVRAIRKFLAQSKEALLPTGAKLSADVFGFTMLVPDDLGIGQDITELAPVVDYLSPMVYPSHFPDGAMGLNGQPNDFPYETIEISLRTGREQLGSARQLRPWLQDFDFFDMAPYGAEEVRAQIQACEDIGASGWMLWDPNNVYTIGALGPDNGNLADYRVSELVANLPTTATPQSGSRRRRAAA